MRASESMRGGHLPISVPPVIAPEPRSLTGLSPHTGDAALPGLPGAGALLPLLRGRLGP